MTKIDNIIQSLAETMDFCGYYTPEVDLFARSLLRVYGSDSKLPKPKSSRSVWLTKFDEEKDWSTLTITPETSRDFADTID